jgi:hypothetical protein
VIRERTPEEKLNLVISRLVAVEAAQKRWDERFQKLAWLDADRTSHQTVPGRVTLTTRGAS